MLARLKTSEWGYLAPGQQGPGTLRVEYLFSGGGVYALRSSPAP